MSVIRWEEPPRRRTADDERAAELAPVAHALRGKPREWAVVHEAHAAKLNAVASFIKAGKGPFAPKGSFEVTQRASGGSGAVYARYVGEPS